jgi:hypothetical protein
VICQLVGKQMRGVDTFARKRHHDYRYTEQTNERRDLHRYIRHDGFRARQSNPAGYRVHPRPKTTVVVRCPMQRSVCGGLAYLFWLVVTR